MSTVLNPAFDFDVPISDAAQPWELSGLVEAARKDPASQHGSSTDSKVQLRLQARNAAKAVTGKHRSLAPAAFSDGLTRKQRKSSASIAEKRTSDGNGASPSLGTGLPGNIRQDNVSIVNADDIEMRPQSGNVGGAEAADHREVSGSDDLASDEEEAEQTVVANGNTPLLEQAPPGTEYKASSFAALKLSRPLLKACAELGYTVPTAVQAACVPLALLGRDICGSAHTGSGKTAAFALPVLERLLLRSRHLPAIYVLVLTPTRELAVQVHSMVTKLAQFTDVRVALVVGGLSLAVQATTLRSNPEIVVATPGRLIDHLRNTQLVGLEDLQVLVLDEADRLLGMGFTDEVQQIVAMAPRERQTMLFSATMTEDVQQLVHASLRRPVRVAASVVDSAPPQLTQEIVRLKGSQVAQKEATVLSLAAASYASGRTIVFFATKVAAHRMKLLFGLAELPPAAELHGNMSQTGRLEALDAFRKGEAAFLLATDVAARGLDILGVQNVINYDAPSSLEAYLHRIGRTARAGAAGRALTFVTDNDRPLLKQVVKRTGTQLQIRVPVPQSVREWDTRVEAVEEELQAILAQEREEMELRRADMQAVKAQNMIDHSDEILSRPARTWFQSPQQKKDAASASMGSQTKASSLKTRSFKDPKAKAKRKAREEDTPEEARAVAKGIRAKKDKETELRGQGITSGKAAKMVKAASDGPVKSQRKAKKRLRDGEDGAEEVKQANLKRPSKVYSGGATIRKFEPKTVSKKDKTAAKRGGTGKRAFKSKAKHKRR